MKLALIRDHMISELIRCIPGKIDGRCQEHIAILKVDPLLLTPRLGLSASDPILQIPDHSINGHACCRNLLIGPGIKALLAMIHGKMGGGSKVQLFTRQRDAEESSP
ncbi:hypothetical protein J28TS4_22600 [Paenibacillus lautus]|nr:hypothetical protein J28TS4_22600 [Paenibacillus lautus]